MGGPVIPRVQSARQSRRLRLQPAGPVLPASEAVVLPEMPGGESGSQTPAWCLRVQPVPCTPRPLVGSTSRLFPTTSPPAVASDSTWPSPRPSPSREQEEPELRGSSAGLGSHSTGPSQARVRGGHPGASAGAVFAVIQPHPWGTLGHHPHFQITQKQAPGHRVAAGSTVQNRAEGRGGGEGGGGARGRGLRGVGEGAGTLASPRCWPCCPSGRGRVVLLRGWHRWHQIHLLAASPSHLGPD